MLIRLMAVSSLLLLVACGQDDEVAEPATETTAAPAAAPAAASPPAGIERRSAPAGAQAYFISPTDGETVDSPVRVLFGLTGMGVVPAGIEREDAGHHHLLIDTELGNFDLPIPADDNHVHFGGGQTETEVELEPGSHTLQLVLGDERHVPHDPPVVSEPITIEVR